MKKITESSQMLGRDFLFPLSVLLLLALASGERSDDAIANEQIDNVLQTYGTLASVNPLSSDYGGNIGISSDLSADGIGSELQYSRTSDPSLRLPIRDGSTFLDLDPVDSLDLDLPRKVKAGGPHIHINLGSKAGRGREKDEEKIAALLEASKLAKQSMQTLKACFVP